MRTVTNVTRVIKFEVGTLDSKSEIIDINDEVYSVRFQLEDLEDLLEYKTVRDPNGCSVSVDLHDMSLTVSSEPVKKTPMGVRERNVYLFDPKMFLYFIRALEDLKEV